MSGRAPGGDSAPGRNIHPETVASFGNEWSEFDQRPLSDAELQAHFEAYFSIFPWDKIDPMSEGFDMGCGSGRWAKIVAPRVGVLNCVDPSASALEVARRNLAFCPGARVIHASVDATPLQPSSQDFGYSLGVLHHVPDTLAALKSCARLLKPGAPFLLYLYYNFDNRPPWFRQIWRCSEAIRLLICRLPPEQRRYLTDPLAMLIYWPLARFCWMGEALGFDMRNTPLYAYRRASLYTMRTDSRDRFGTPLEQRFTRREVEEMMKEAGFSSISFSDGPPFWCALGTKGPIHASPT